jgi:hypothetical protein
MYQLRWYVPNGTELIANRRGEMLSAPSVDMLASTIPILVRDCRYVVLMRRTGTKWMRIMEWRDGIERRFSGAPGPSKGATYAPRGI